MDLPTVESINSDHGFWDYLSTDFQTIQQQLWSMIARTRENQLLFPRLTG